MMHGFLQFVVAPLPIFLGAHAVSAASGPMQQQIRPAIDIQLRPEAPVAGQITAVEITITTTVGAIPSGGHLLMLRAMLQSGKMSADDVQNLIVSDTAGNVPLKVETVVDNDDNSERYWNVGRPVSA